MSAMSARADRSQRLRSRRPPARRTKAPRRPVSRTRWRPLLMPTLAIVLVLLAFVAAFVLDPGAVARLEWAALIGLFGLAARLMAAGVVLAIAAPLITPV